MTAVRSQHQVSDGPGLQERSDIALTCVGAPSKTPLVTRLPTVEVHEVLCVHRPGAGVPPCAPMAPPPVPGSHCSPSHTHGPL